MKRFIHNSMLLLLGGVALLLTSCYASKVVVGDVKPYEPMVKVGSKWNGTILCGLINVSAPTKASDYVGDKENYMMKTSHSLMNYIVQGITFGIYSPTQTKFYLTKNDAWAPRVINESDAPAASVE